jgi:hypothetical protein
MYIKMIIQMCEYFFFSFLVFVVLICASDTDLR